MISLNLNEAMRERDAEQRREANVRKLKRAARPELQRGYNAARYNNLTADWSTSQTTANSELRRDLRSLRARSNELARNNSLMKRYLDIRENYVVGAQGIALRVKLAPHGNSNTERDAEIVREIQEWWTDWCRPENASASGKMSFTEQLCFAERMIDLNGEFLCREVFNADNEFGYALQFRHPSWLDETYNAVLENGNRVLMSVEVNQFERPVRYWLTRPASDYLYGEWDVRGQYRTPVPASELIHKYVVNEDEAQTRGVPSAHAAMEDIHTLGGFVQAELYAARANACNMDYLIPPADEDEDGEPSSQNPVHPDFPVGAVRELQSASQQVLGPGYKVQSNDPKHPNSNAPDFIKGVKRDISSGLDGVPYEDLANDRENVNYGSMRGGRLDSLESYRRRQHMLIYHLCHRVFQSALKQSMLNGRLNLSIRDYDRIRDLWRGRGYDWVDPLKDGQAAILLANNGFSSITKYCDERGEDFDEVVQQRKEEIQKLKEAGLLDWSALAPAKPKPDMTQPGEKPPAASDDANANDNETARVLPFFEPQLLPPAVRSLAGTQPIIIVVNQPASSPGSRLPAPGSRPANGDSEVLS
jgi:lambda family phage portal protein